MSPNNDVTMTTLGSKNNM